jgi:hypothetical protein
MRARTGALASIRGTDTMDRYGRVVSKRKKHNAWMQRILTAVFAGVKLVYPWGRQFCTPVAPVRTSADGHQALTVVRFNSTPCAS